jgi:hypothetical protein
MARRWKGNILHLRRPEDDGSAGDSERGLISQRAGYDVSRDGQRFLFQVASEDPGAAPIRLVQNWPAAKVQ